ncbi:ATP-binding protein [Halotalea alkalilenta]|uniref:ATP-binding protein n=1 Tax=Halotalea alkalilenta TaxID=376489 RepID=UPI0006948384|nr:sensor histidine kinase [Halotalea alkalilenta]
MTSQAERERRATRLSRSGRGGVLVAPRRRPRISLALQVWLLVLSMIAAALGLAYVLFDRQMEVSARILQEHRLLNLAELIADRESSRGALEASPGSPERAAFATQIQRWRERLGVDYIVVMDLQGLRLSHPDPSRIGGRYDGGDEGPALRGEHYVSRAAGSIGEAIRGYAPVRDSDGVQLGAVAVGITLSRIALLDSASRSTVLFGLAFIVALGSLGAFTLAWSIRRRLMGMEPEQIARLVNERHAMLDSLREGVIATDDASRVVLINPSGRRMLLDAGLLAMEPGHSATPLFGTEVAQRVLAQGEEVVDLGVRCGDGVFIASYRPIRLKGRVIGAIMTFRERGEVQRHAEELTGVRRYAEALRANTHEFKNRLHVIQGLVQLGDISRLRLYLRELIEHGAITPGATFERLREPILAAFLLGKRSEATERGVALNISVENEIPPALEHDQAHSLVTIIGNLVENALEAVAQRSQPEVLLLLEYDEVTQSLSLHVQDNGPGIAPALRERIFDHGFSSKGEGRGVGLYLVREYVELAEGTLSLYSEPERGTLIEVTYPYAATRDVSAP